MNKNEYNIFKKESNINDINLIKEYLGLNKKENKREDENKNKDINNNNYEEKGIDNLLREAVSKRI